MCTDQERIQLTEQRTALVDRIEEATALIAELPEGSPELEAVCARLLWATREAGRIDRLMRGPNHNSS